MKALNGVSKSLLVLYYHLSVFNPNIFRGLVALKSPFVTSMKYSTTPTYGCGDAYTNFIANSTFKTLQIGLTGSIGMGKSTVAR